MHYQLFHEVSSIEITDIQVVTGKNGSASRSLIIRHVGYHGEDLETRIVMSGSQDQPDLLALACEGKQPWRSTSIKT